MKLHALAANPHSTDYKYIQGERRSNFIQGKIFHASLPYTLHSFTSIKNSPFTPLRSKSKRILNFFGSLKWEFRLPISTENIRWNVLDAWAEMRKLRELERGQMMLLNANKLKSRDIKTKWFPAISTYTRKFCQHSGWKI